MSSSPGFAKQLWLQWKSLKLPWRRQFLVGSDLAGNTFWEFRDQLNATRYRRMVKYATQAHYSDIKISPQWHQWLRHTRREAPSIEEQQYDLSRQAMMKQLAAEADERWNSIPSFLDSPNTQRSQPAIGMKDHGAKVSERSLQQSSTITNNIQNEGQQIGDLQNEATKIPNRREREENPWQKQATGAPSQNWQPESWSPGTARRGE
ncbi:Hypothetical protein R9X50_00177700 [Acrodontium crateriforme]|uniref:NADH dehydrogenase [ubiquinone] 1 alpha subcomplex subunit n=1 Tax=Acrodontium crateriforme TaxID=150365 RepID=A0AAQ3M317_9PEZI|nr:Hypothetical protein R9X50_00177700 [Acrodontium crateriforme]